MTDAIGSTESGMNGIRFVQKGDAPKEGITTVMASADTVVLDDDLNPLEPGTGIVGRLARGGNIPLGYYNDPGEDRGDVRHRLAGSALVDPRRLRAARSRRSHHVARTRLGLDQLRRREDLPRRGRGRVEVAPRCVRRARGRHCPTSDGARRVTALLQPRGDKTPTLEELQAHCRGRIAGYKVPRRVDPRRRGAAAAQRQARLPPGQGTSARSGRTD